MREHAWRDLRHLLSRVLVVVSIVVVIVDWRRVVLGFLDHAGHEL